MSPPTPTSDVQFLAGITMRIFNGDQVTSGELNRLRKLYDTGVSSPQDELGALPEAAPTLAPHAQGDPTAPQIALSHGATRAGGF